MKTVAAIVVVADRINHNEPGLTPSRLEKCNAYWNTGADSELLMKYYVRYRP
jgi:hypothetical protein